MPDGYGLVYYTYV